MTSFPYHLRCFCWMLLLGLPILAKAQEPGGPSRLSPDLQRGLARTHHDSLTLSVRLQASSVLPSGPWRTLKEYPRYHSLLLRLPRRALDRLSELPEVIFISEHAAPKEELSTGASDPTLNAITLVGAKYPGLRGDSLSALIKERRFDTGDLDLRPRVLRTGREAPTQTAHASLMATLVAGAGNTAPEARGAAPGARLGSTDFSQLFPDPDSLLQRLRISVQNHSYGTVVENFYGNEAAAYDQQVVHLRNLVQVFSAGNSGATAPVSGPYAGINGVANLTGNFKQAKNILTVGSVDSSGALLPLSSRGPAYDGRIKPELMAYGEDGSSGAAALVSGVALIVQDSYRQLHSDSLPPEALIRAVLLNSAEDMGNPHPDYATGFGLMNAWEAVQTIRAGHTLRDSLTQGETKSFALPLPSHVRRVKITLAWTDPAALPNASRALVHDLDLSLRQLSTGQQWLPWVLDPTASAGALAALAQRKRDTLNNIEQVTVDLPPGGDYRIEVRGMRVTGGHQAFALAWQVDSLDGLYWTFPSGDALEAGRAQWIRWKTDRSGPALIEYATSGANWRPVASLQHAAVNGYRWTLPDTATTALLRLRFPGGAEYRSDTFTIGPRVQAVTGFDCVDSFQLYWNRVPNATYELLRLSNGRLESFLQRSDTSVVLGKNSSPEIHYTVLPRINGRPGLRGLTLNYAGQSVGCYIRSFFLESQVGSTARFGAELGSLYRVASVTLEKGTATGWAPEQTHAPTGLQLAFAILSLRQGENRYRLRVQLTDGTSVYSAPVVVFYLDGKSLIVYPNPAPQGSPVQLYFDEVGRYRYQLFDATGKKLGEGAVNANRIVLPTTSYAGGLYFLRIQDRQGGGFTQKLIIR